MMQGTRKKSLYGKNNLPDILFLLFGYLGELFFCIDTEQLLEFSPGISHEQKKQRIQFQTAGQHIEDQYNLGKI